VIRYHGDRTPRELVEWRSASTLLEADRIATELVGRYRGPERAIQGEPYGQVVIWENGRTFEPPRPEHVMIRRPVAQWLDQQEEG
jgi:hypothetical protein